MSTENYVEDKPKKIKEIRAEAEQKSCAVQRALYFVDEFAAKPMCGKCYPCALGTGEAQIRLDRLSRRKDAVDEKDLELLERIGDKMVQGSLCKRGKDTGEFILEIISNARDEFEKHISHSCPNKECKNLIQYEIDPELCDMCGECKQGCRFNAILGEKKHPFFSGYQPFQIRQKRCTRCGECVDLCPTGAIVLNPQSNK